LVIIVLTTTRPMNLKIDVGCQDFRMQSFENWKSEKVRVSLNFHGARRNTINMKTASEVT
jgi:hypothetical protein